MHRLSRRVLLPALALALALAWCGTRVARAQGGAQPAGHDGPDYEVQLYLLVTAGGAEGAAKVPQGLDGVVRQLKSTLPPADYRLAATFINRVRDGGKFEVKTVGGSPFATPHHASARAKAMAGGNRLFNTLCIRNPPVGRARRRVGRRGRGVP